MFGIEEKHPFNKIVNGKVYDTYSAELLAYRLLDSFHYTVYQLYKKKCGEFFILIYEHAGHADDYIVPQNDIEFNMHLEKFRNLPSELLSQVTQTPSQSH